MATEKKPPAKKTSPFGTSNRDAVFGPKKSEFSVTEFDNNRASYRPKPKPKPKPKPVPKPKPKPKPKKPVTNYPNSSTSRTRPQSAIPPKKPVVKKPSTANGGSGSMGGVAVQVVKGDTLWAIAKRAIQRTGQTPTNAKINSSLQALIRAHPEYQKNPNLIRPGQVVRW